MIPNYSRVALTAAAKKIVADVCSLKMGAMKRAPRDEIDFVSSLVLYGSSKLQDEWRKILHPSGVHVRVAGVFCHQSPMVRIADKPPYPVKKMRCELADLLILHSHSRQDGRRFWRAVLMQTKKDNGNPAVPDEPQLWLYRDWPNFSIRSRGYDPRIRNFGTDQRSGRYALVSSSGWFVLPPQRSIYSSMLLSSDLATFLVDMLYDMDPHQNGRTSTSGRQVYRQSQADWSATVWDLISITATRPLRHLGRKRGLFSAPKSRVGGSFLSMIAGSACALPPIVDRVSRGEEEEPGLSTLFVETRVDDAKYGV